MRIIGLMVAASLVASVPARAEWKEYMFADLGVRKDFPSDPKTSMDTYKTALVPGAPAHRVTATVPGVIYTMTVVDLQERSAAGDSATILGECVHNAIAGGKKLLADMSTDQGRGKTRVYGRWVSVDLPDGNRMLTACYFNRGRLYMVQSNLLKTAEDFPNSPDTFRFVNSLDFNMDPDRDAPRPPRPPGAAPGAAAPAAGAAPAAAPAN